MATFNVVSNPTAFERIKRFADSAASGDYGADCRLGRQLADELIADMSASGFGGSLGHVVRDLVEHGTFTAIQTGFFQRIAEYAIA